jgi:lipoate---protein ligase
VSAQATERGDAGRFRVQGWRGSAAELHALDWPDPLVPTAWDLRVTAPALVLGSTQRAADVDRGVLDELGLGLAGRRSGGGAVLVEPGNGVWLDVLIPRRDPAWVDDIGRAFTWLGQVWVSALASLGLDAHLYEGPPERGALARAVCFAGLGSGEVTLGGAKAVGLSQRRTRSGARFQCTCYRRWRPEPLRALGIDPAALAPVAEVDVDPDTLVQAVLGVLARSVSRPR